MFLRKYIYLFLLLGMLGKVVRMKTDRKGSGEVDLALLPV